MNSASMFSRNAFRTRSPKGIELLFLEEPLALVSCFSELKSSDYEKLGEAIGHIFLVNRKSADLLSICATEEIYSSSRNNNSGNET